MSQLCMMENETKVSELRKGDMNGECDPNNNIYIKYAEQFIKSETLGPKNEGVQMTNMGFVPKNEHGTDMKDFGFNPVKETILYHHKPKHADDLDLCIVIMPIDDEEKARICRNNHDAAQEPNDSDMIKVEPKELQKNDRAYPDVNNGIICQTLVEKTESKDEKCLCEDGKTINTDANMANEEVGCVNAVPLQNKPLSDRKTAVPSLVDDDDRMNNEYNSLETAAAPLDNAQKDNQTRQPTPDRTEKKRKSLVEHGVKYNKKRKNKQERMKNKQYPRPNKSTSDGTTALPSLVDNDDQMNMAGSLNLVHVESETAAETTSDNTQKGNQTRQPTDDESEKKKKSLVEHGVKRNKKRKSKQEHVKNKQCFSPDKSPSDVTTTSATTLDNAQKDNQTGQPTDDKTDDQTRQPTDDKTEKKRKSLVEHGGKHNKKRKSKQEHMKNEPYSRPNNSSSDGTTAVPSLVDNDDQLNMAGSLNLVHVESSETAATTLDNAQKVNQPRQPTDDKTDDQTRQPTDDKTEKKRKSLVEHDGKHNKKSKSKQERMKNKPYSRPNKSPSDGRTTSATTLDNTQKDNQTRKPTDDKTDDQTRQPTDDKTENKRKSLVEHGGKHNKKRKNKQERIKNKPYPMPNMRHEYHTFICPEKACGYGTSKAANFKSHEQLHLKFGPIDLSNSYKLHEGMECESGGIHPSRPCNMQPYYICPQPNCSFVGFGQHHVIKHIREMHTDAYSPKALSSLESSLVLETKLVCAIRKGTTTKSKVFCKKCGETCSGIAPEDIPNQQQPPANMIMHYICTFQRCNYSSCSCDSLYAHTKQAHGYSGKLDTFALSKFVVRVYLPNPKNGGFDKHPCPSGMERWWMCPVVSCVLSNKNRVKIKTHLYDAHRRIMTKTQLKKYYSYKIGLPSKILPKGENPENPKESSVTKDSDSGKHSSDKNKDDHEKNKIAKSRSPKIRRVCSHCDKEYYARQSQCYLDEHMRVYHSKTIMMYQCPVDPSCKYTSIYESDVRSHITTQHVRHMTSKQIKMYTNDTVPIPSNLQDNPKYMTNCENEKIRKSKKKLLSEFRQHKIDKRKIAKHNSRTDMCNASDCTSNLQDNPKIMTNFENEEIKKSKENPLSKVHQHKIDKFKIAGTDICNASDCSSNQQDNPKLMTNCENEEIKKSKETTLIEGHQHKIDKRKIAEHNSRKDTSNASDCTSNLQDNPKIVTNCANEEIKKSKEKRLSEVHQHKIDELKIAKHNSRKDTSNASDCTCNVCGKIFSKPAKLKSHKKAKGHGSSFKDMCLIHLCPEEKCVYFCHTADRMKLHMKKHTRAQ